MRDAQRKIDCEYYRVRPIQTPIVGGHTDVVQEPICTLPGSPNSALIRNTRRAFEENCAKCEHNKWQRD